jgi:uncharacterized membrane protein YeaQ/YmgE (transglycosylase-associated protein family)
MKFLMPARRFSPPWSIEGIGYNFRAWQLCRAARIGVKMQDGQALMIWLIVGATAGWLAGMPVKGGGNGLIGDITAPLPTSWITTIVGIIGGLIAGWMLPQIGIIIGGGFIAAIINAFIGAVILLIVLRLVSRAA